MSTDQNTVTDYANQTVQSLGEKLYLDDNTADVYFAVKIGNNDDAIERIPAHKCQLAAASNVFKAMFFGDIKELGDVKLTDIHVSAFKEFLQFFYLSRVQLTMENFGEVMNFGQKYNVSECLSVGHRFLRYNLTVDDVCSAYDTALVLDLKEMKEMCEKVISINTEDVFQSDGFLNCTVGTLLKILKLDLLSCYETDVFKACVSWVKATSQQNEVTKELMQIHLGELFYEIRFRLMSFAQFSELIASFGHLFSADELREVIQMIPSKDFEPKLFNNKLRGVEWNETKIIEYVKDLKGGFGNRYLHLLFQN
ncbi:BTB/POZ domain-containing protein 2-like [Contarinia nasturtii]|uniref:BTB/POZ domain-containing protein 2-like n=1 Tax=Contarinia nasturtii TaxID=265458 RepID=UPI0012D465FF|nr:BTB/POZ domain-containing protein 2-like [Contarinia nasturtii]